MIFLCELPSIICMYILSKTANIDVSIDKITSYPLTYSLLSNRLDLLIINSCCMFHIYLVCNILPLLISLNFILL